MPRTKKIITENYQKNIICIDSDKNNIYIDSDKNNICIDSDKKLSEIKSNDQIVITNDNDLICIKDFKKKEKMLYDVLDDFFQKCSLNEVEMIIKIIDGKHIISLRFLDWFVTRYCYLYKLSININNNFNKEENFNINISYKAQLKSFKKRYFDPFRRKKKFIYVFDKHNLNLLTTLGQLNFFRWALSFDIIKYAENNFKIINSKISHVNSYFKKTIDTNSLTISTSEENNSSSNDLNQSDINLLMGLDNNVLKTHKIKPSKIFKDLKNLPSTSKYPQVSRNVFIEF